MMQISVVFSIIILSIVVSLIVGRRVAWEEKTE